MAIVGSNLILSFGNDPSQALAAVTKSAVVYYINGFDIGVAVTNGTGSTGRVWPRSNTNSGATAGGNARLTSNSEMALKDAADSRTVDWSKRIEIRNARVSQSVSTTNGTSLFGLGRRFADTPGADPSLEYIGVRLDGDSLKGLAHDGSCLTVVDLSTTLVAHVSHTVDIISDGAGNVTWFVDGVQAGTTTGGPTGVGTQFANLLAIEAANNADSADQDIRFMGCTLIAER